MLVGIGGRDGLGWPSGRRVGMPRSERQVELLVVDIVVVCWVS